MKLSEAAGNKIGYFLNGMRDGVPIGLGYLAVSFSLGIAARNVGLDAEQGFFASLFTIASAGEYAGFTVIGEMAPYLEMVFVILVANCRYLLMGCALSQKLSPDEKMINRIGTGLLITDEIFGINIAQEGYLHPEYTYGAAVTSIIPWAVATSLGIIVGNLLPARIVTALSVALYGMFIAILVPPARKNRVIAVIIAISFLVSWLGEILPYIREVNGGIRIVIFTVAIAAAAAVLRPVSDNDAEIKGEERS